MGEKTQFRVKSLWANPFKTAGILVVLWLLGLINILFMSFPSYPETRSQWLWFVFAGPPVLLLSWFALEWSIERGKRWLKDRDPELRLWQVILIGLACVGLVAWGLHSVP